MAAAKFWAKIVGAVVGVIVLFGVGSAFLGLMGYWWEDVESDEVGIKFAGNRPYEVVGPGKHTDYGLGNIGQFKSLETIKVYNLPFQVQDDEVLTKDLQRIGVTVTGDVRRPGLDKADVLLELWSRYRNYYTQDNLLVGGRPATAVKDAPATSGLMQSLTLQASKVCIGERNFADSVVGEVRDELRACIDRELNGLAAGYGLIVSNVVVPNIVLSKEVQAQLDSITQARFQTQVANQQKLLADAQAQQRLAEERGAIIVEQGKIQEKAKQDAETAKLQTAAAQAQSQVITAQKSNELLGAQKDQEIAASLRDKATIDAQAANAPRLAEARIFQENPAYAHYKETEVNANAYSKADKFLVVSPDTHPLIQVGSGGGSVIVSNPNQPAR
jgi:hypothetical protein